MDNQIIIIFICTHYLLRNGEVLLNNSHVKGKERVFTYLYDKEEVIKTPMSVQSSNVNEELS